MMFKSFYINLFKNKYKENGDTKPLYTNSNFTVTDHVELEVGKIYKVAMWKDNDKLDKNNNPYLSIKIDEKQDEEEVQETPVEMPNDDIF